MYLNRRSINPRDLGCSPDGEAGAASVVSSGINGISITSRNSQYACQTYREPCIHLELIHPEYSRSLKSLY